MIGLRRFCLSNGRPVWKYHCCESKRTIYSLSSLGIDSFISQRRITLESIPDPVVFKERLKHICDNNKRSLVFVEDLRKMIAIADSDEDLELLFSLLRKYSKQREAIVFQTYNMGPDTMRLLYLKNRHLDAVQLVEDEQLFPYFQHVVTVTMLLDLLFENCLYGDVIRFFEMYQDKLQFGFPPASWILVYLAACYKLNTAECFEKALKIQKSSVLNKQRSPLRNSLLFAALAIKQNQPFYAIEIFAFSTFNSVIENLKCMAYAQAKCFDNVFCEIKGVLSSSKVGEFFLTNEAVCFIENEIKREDCNRQYDLDFQKLKEELVMQNIIVHEPLDKYLCGEISYFGNNRTLKKPSRNKKNLATAAAH